MGQPKQLLPYRGGTLVEHAILQAQQAGFAPLVVVVGSQSKDVSSAVERRSVRWVANQHWQSGMGSSISIGINCILDGISGLQGVAVLLADQPLILASDLTAMQREFENRIASKSPKILAAFYNGALGVPAIFPSSAFEQLKNLSPELGARALLRGNNAQVNAFELPQAGVDIDTPEDFASLVKLPA